MLVTFLLKAGVLYVIWHLFYQQVLEEDGVFIRRVAEHVAHVCVYLADSLGFNAAISRRNGFSTLIMMNHEPSVWIDSGCTGLTLMALFAGFVIAYPGPIIKKLWYIPVGLVVIYIVNIIRVLALAINHGHSSFDFNHKYTYTIFTYVAIFVLWMVWANRLSGVSLGNNQDPEDPAGTLPADESESKQVSVV